MLPRLLPAALVPLTAILFGLALWLALAPSQEGESWQKGFAFYDEPPAYASMGAVESLRQLRETGTQIVVPVVTWYVPNAQGSEIVAGPFTPSDEDLAFIVEETKRLGFDVVLMMHINSLDGTWRGFIDPADKQAWFDAYGQILNLYAELAQRHGLRGMIVGSELVQLTRPQFTDQWRRLIRDVRQRFSGFLTYSAQWGSNGPELQSEPLEEYTQIGFWSDLDYLGLAAYFNLAPSVDVRPSREELRQTWEEWRRREIAPFQAAHGKPLLFTEVGYKSTNGAAARPWDEALFNGVNLDLQADLYTALFEAWRDVPWFEGVYFWYWSTNPAAGGPNDQGYPPQNKPAEEVVRNWFGRIPTAASAQR